MFSFSKDATLFELQHRKKEGFPVVCWNGANKNSSDRSRYGLCIIPIPLTVCYIWYINAIVGFISIPLILAYTPPENKRLVPEKDGLNQSRNLHNSPIFRRSLVFGAPWWFGVEKNPQVRNCSYQNLVMTSLADWSLGSVRVETSVEKIQRGMEQKWQTLSFELLDAFVIVLVCHKVFFRHWTCSFFEGWYVGRIFVHVFPTGSWKGRAACFSCHFPSGNKSHAFGLSLTQDASHGKKTSTFSAVFGYPGTKPRPLCHEFVWPIKLRNFSWKLFPHDPQQRFWKHRLFKDHSKQYFHRDSNKAWKFFVTFLGWPSDPFKG